MVLACVARVSASIDDFRVASAADFARLYGVVESTAEFVFFECINLLAVQRNGARPEFRTVRIELNKRTENTLESLDADEVSS